MLIAEMTVEENLRLTVYPRRPEPATMLISSAQGERSLLLRGLMRSDPGSSESP